MEARYNKTAVRTFIAGSVIFFTSFIVWFFANTLLISYQSYIIIFPSSIAGLYDGSPVTYNGVQVGKITHISINSDFNNKVVAKAIIDKQIKIKEDTYATLSMRGMTGQMFLELDGGSTSSPLLKKKNNLFIIQYKESILENITIAAPKLLDKLNVLIGKIDQLFNKQNQINITSTLSNVNNLLLKLPNITQKLEILLDNTNKITTNIPNKINHILKDSKPLTNNLGDLLINLKQFSHKLNNHGIINILSNNQSL